MIKVCPEFSYVRLENIKTQAVPTKAHVYSLAIYKSLNITCQFINKNYVYAYAIYRARSEKSSHERDF